MGTIIKMLTTGRDQAEIKCDNCGNTFTFGDRVGIPNGVSFITKKGTITLCADCIIKIGKMNPHQRDEFLKRLNKE